MSYLISFIVKLIVCMIPAVLIFAMAAGMLFYFTQGNWYGVMAVACFIPPFLIAYAWCLLQ